MPKRRAQPCTGARAVLSFFAMKRTVPALMRNVSRGAARAPKFDGGFATAS